MTAQPTPQTAALAKRQDDAIASASYDRQFQMALEPQDFMSAYKAAAMLASVGLCGVRTAEEALIRILAGRGVGLTLMASMRFVYVVEGRPALDASLMHGLCLRRSDCEKFDCVEDTSERVSYVVKRRGKAEFTVTWSMDDARAAKLVDRGKDPSSNNWNKYPRRMLHARAKSEGAQRGWPDVMAGLSSVEEVRDAIDTTGEQVFDDPEPGQVLPDGFATTAPPASAYSPVAPEPARRQPAAPPPPPPDAFDVEPIDAHGETVPAPAPERVAQPAPQPQPPPPPPPPPPAPPAPAPAPAPAPPAQARPAGARDWDAELAALRVTLSRVTARSELEVIRRQISSWDAPTPWLSQAKDAYNEVTKRVRA